MTAPSKAMILTRSTLIATLAALAACSEPAAPRPTPPSAVTPAGTPADSGAHAHAAPHGGLLVPLGDHFANLELVVNRESGRLDLFVLGEHAEQAVRLRQVAIPCVLAVANGTPIPIDLGAQQNTLTGERAGDTSQFAGAHVSLVGDLPFTLTIESIEVRGARFGPVRIEAPAAK